MTSELLKSFLVGLGFDVDDSSLAKFNKSIASATLRVTALYGSIKLTTAAVAYGISKISDSFEQLGYEYKILAPAINKALVLRQEMLKAYRAAGINLGEVVRSAAKLNISLTKTKYALEALYKSVASRFFPLLTKQSELFRKKLYENMPRIQATLERMVKFLFQAFDAVSILGVRLWSVLGRVYDFFVQLDKATDGWSTKILAAVAAWKFLNLQFIATPLGMILTGLVALLALFDDFKTWQEGGESLFDWTTFVPVIEAVTTVVKSLWEVLKGVGETLGTFAASIYSLFTGNFRGALDIAGEAFGKLGETIKKYLVYLLSFVDALGAVGSWAGKTISGFFSNPNVGSNVQGAPNGVPVTSPIGGGTQNSSTRQQVSQQTEINIHGVADALQAGAAVGSQQSKVNFDLVRNLKGATTP